jgi:anti-sigma factor RsiW
MSIDDILLMAYVDGDVSAERRAEVEAAVAHSPELAARLASLRASVLPYGAAFGRQLLPPVPLELAKRVAELASVSANSRGALRRRTSLAWLAAAFFAGALLCGGLLRLWPSAAPVSLTASVAPWIEAVSNYHALYSRATVADVTEDRALSEKVIRDVRHIDGMPVRVPDLRDAGLTFKRVQRLSFRNQPVVQIVYLPERGEPVALCVTQDLGANEAPHAQPLGEVKSVAWRHDGLGYVLLGKGSLADLSAWAQQIATGEARILYSRVAMQPPSHAG